MSTTIFTHETPNNTYRIIKTSKTTYEQQQKHKQERNFMILQRLIGILFTLLCVIGFTLFPDRELRGSIIFVTLPIALLVALINKPILSL